MRLTVMVIILVAVLSGRMTSAFALSCTAPHAQWGSEGPIREMLKEAQLILIGQVAQSGLVPCRGAYVYYRMKVTEALKGDLVPAAASDGTIVVAHQVWEGCRKVSHDLGPLQPKPLLYLASRPRTGSHQSTETLDGRRASIELGPCSFGYDVSAPLGADAQVIRDRLIEELRSQRNARRR